MGLKRGLRGVYEYLHLQPCTLYMLSFCQNKIQSCWYLRGVFDTYTYICCVYTLGLCFSIYLTTLAVTHFAAVGSTAAASGAAALVVGGCKCWGVAESKAALGVCVSQGDHLQPALPF